VNKHSPCTYYPAQTTSKQMNSSLKRVYDQFKLNSIYALRHASKQVDRHCPYSLPVLVYTGKIWYYKHNMFLLPGYVLNCYRASQEEIIWNNNVLLVFSLFHIFRTNSSPLPWNYILQVKVFWSVTEYLPQRHAQKTSTWIFTTVKTSSLSFPSFLCWIPLNHRTFLFVCNITNI